MDDERVWKEHVDEMVTSIRPKSLKRLLLLRVIIYREIYQRGPLSTEFLDPNAAISLDEKFEIVCKKLRQERYDELRPVAEQILTDEQLSLVFDITDRTQQDYITALYLSAKFR